MKLKLIYPNIPFWRAETSRITLFLGDVEFEDFQSAVLNEEYDIPYKGKYSWLYAGEAASAFIYSVMKEFTKAYVFNLNGQCETIENGLTILKSLKPEAKVTCSGQNFPFST